MGAVDLLVIAWLVTTALVGLRRGLAGQLVALAGFAVGAVIGSRVAPLLLHGGDRSPWRPIVSLAGAVVCGLLVQAASTPLADRARFAMRTGPLDVIDRAGGLLAGTLLGLLAVWMLAVAALHQPALGMRQVVQRSAILPPLVADLPAGPLMDALQRFDRLPVIAGAVGNDLPPPDPTLGKRPPVAAAIRTVAKIEGSACGIQLSGSGWVVRTGLVATNAHVIAGESDTEVEIGGQTFPATPVYVNADRDVALLAVRGLDVTPLRTKPIDTDSEAVVLAGYPGGGPLQAPSGTAGRPVPVFSANAYGQGLSLRTVVPLRGPLQHGDSGGPVLDSAGRVVAMMFAKAQRGGGFGVPVEDVVDALGSLVARADTGPCIS